MSERDVISEANEEYFRELDGVYQEPLITKVFEEMRVYNELLSREYVDGKRINEIMNELDGLWRELMMQNAVASGFFYFVPENVSDGENVPRRDYYENQDVQFNGVLPIQLDMTWDGDGQEVHTYELRVQLIKEGIVNDEKSTYLEQRGSARVDDIISLEFPDIMSPERARRWLEHYHSEQAGDIDVLLLNPSAEECDMVSRLTGMMIDYTEVHGDDSALAIRSSQALNIYTNSLFSFDKDMPYDATLHGDSWTVYDDGSFVPSEIVEPTRTPISISQVVWISPQEGNGILGAHLDAHILSEDKDSDGYHILLPLTSVKTLHSLRHAYFGGYDKG